MKAVSLEEENEKRGSHRAQSPSCVLLCHGSAPAVSLSLAAHPRKAPAQAYVPGSAPCRELDGSLSGHAGSQRHCSPNGTGPPCRAAEDAM